MDESSARASAEFIFAVETHLLCLKNPASLTLDELDLVEQYALAELGPRSCADHIIRNRKDECSI